jgi:hypothetical protein
MVLYLKSSALDTGVVAWAFYDGAGKRLVICLGIRPRCPIRPVSMRFAMVGG